MEGIWTIAFNFPETGITRTVSNIEFRKGGIFFQEKGNYYGTWVYNSETGKLNMNYIGNMVSAVMLESTLTKYTFTGENSNFKWHATKHGYPPEPEPKQTRSGKRY